MHQDRYEDEEIVISLAPHPFPDRFEIKFDGKSRVATVRRLDADSGWGQDLRLVVLDKPSGKKTTVRVGPSFSNLASASTEGEHSHNISFRMSRDQMDSAFPKKRKVYLALATIPSRIKRPIFFKQLESLIEGQSMPADKVFVTVAEKYKRLGDSTVDEESLSRLKGYDKVDVIVTEDYGPACKYMGPLIHRKEEIEGGLLVVVDDDRFYNPNLIRHFSVGFDLYPKCRFASGDGSLYFRAGYESMSEEAVGFRMNKGSGCLEGFYGFCMRVESLEEFVEYHKVILERIPKSFFHDEGISKVYIGAKKAEFLLLDHMGCMRIAQEPPDALCQTTPVGRGWIEEEIARLTLEEGLLSDG